MSCSLCGMNVLSINICDIIKKKMHWNKILNDVQKVIFPFDNTKRDEGVLSGKELRPPAAAGNK